MRGLFLEDGVSEIHLKKCTQSNLATKEPGSKKLFLSQRHHPQRQPGQMGTEMPNPRGSNRFTQGA